MNQNMKQIRNMLKEAFYNENTPLDFDTVQDLDLSISPPDESEKEEASRYDNITDLPSKRKQILWDIKNGVIDSSEFPSVLPLYSKFIDKLPSGQFLIKGAANSPKEKELYTKTIKFINSGSMDALSSKGAGEVKKIISSVAEEISRHLPLDHDHPTRKLISLMKNGTLDDSMRFYLKKHHYDIFGDSFYNYIRPLILNKIGEIRQAEFDARKSGIN